MALTVEISLDVTPLPDDDVWFANAAAWSEYWQNINIEATFDALNNALYVESPYDMALVSPTITADDGAPYNLATEEMISSLLNAYNTLNTSYKLLRNELKAAGLLTNSQ